jgi:molecular chaperone GrpE
MTEPDDATADLPEEDQPTTETVEAPAEQDVSEDAEPEVRGSIAEAPVFTQTDIDRAVAAAAADAEDRRLRVLAEYDNFRRRTGREREKWAADAVTDLVKDLLPVADSLDKAAETNPEDAAALAEGLAAIRRQLALMLEKNEIAACDPVGEPFDPQFHEALTRQPSPDHEPNTVLAVVEKGYTLEGRLLRAARVVVSAPAEES